MSFKEIFLKLWKVKHLVHRLEHTQLLSVFKDFFLKCTVSASLNWSYIPETYVLKHFGGYKLFKTPVVVPCKGVLAVRDENTGKMYKIFYDANEIQTYNEMWNDEVYTLLQNQTISRLWLIFIPSHNQSLFLGFRKRNKDVKMEFLLLHRPVFFFCPQ